jgi:hypothetical protein
MKGKGSRKKCFCGVIIVPHRKVGPRQKTCGAKDCQKELKRRNNARWRKNNPDHWRNDYPRVKACWEANPGYLKEYRKSHPEYVEKCRKAQKLRDRAKRLRLVIQDEMRRQKQEVIDKLWKKSRSGNLDIQGEKGSKSLTALLLLDVPPRS